jgi:hypothetical protein
MTIISGPIYRHLRAFWKISTFWILIFPLWFWLGQVRYWLKRMGENMVKGKKRKYRVSVA